MRTLRALFVAVLLPVALPAQLPSGETPWDAFLGCWTSTDEQASLGLSCYLPAADDPRAVEQLLLIQNREVSRSRLILDGQRHEERDATCNGYQIAAGSSDHARVYLRSRTLCGALENEVDGLLAISPAGELIRVYLVGTGERRALLTERLRRVETRLLPDALADPLLHREAQLASARRRASTIISYEQIAEVASVTDVTVTEAWMVEATRGIDGFTAKRSELELLVDRGVDTRVVDMAVAVANPDRFSPVYERPAAPASVGGGAAFGEDMSCYQRLVNNRGTLGFGFWPVFFWNAFPLYGASDCFLAGYFRYRSMGGYWIDGWWPYGQNGWSAGGVGGGGFPTRVVVRPGREDGFGEVQKGNGYSNRGPADGVATPRTPSSGTRSGTRADVNADGGSGIGRTPTANGSGTGRIAQPRTPNEERKP